MMNEKKKYMISIVIPVFNAEGYLCKCLDSVLNQTYTDYEVIVVDDGSTDKSSEICDCYGKRFNNVRIFHKENEGVSIARNFGIKVAQGQFVAFIDADDWIDNNYLYNMISNACEGGIVYMGISINDEAPVFSFAEGNVSKSQAQISIMSDKGIKGYPFGRLFDLNVIRKFNILFDKEIAICEDVLFNLIYINKCYGMIKIIHKAGYHYNQLNTGAVLGRYGGKFIDEKKFTEIDALEKAGQFILNDKKVLKIWKQRRVKAAEATLRTMASYDYTNNEKYKRLKKIIRKDLISYLLGKSGTMQSKIAVVLCAISPILNWKIYKKRKER